MGYGTQVHQVKVEEGREVTQEWTLDKAHLVRIETPGVKGVRVQLGREPPQESPAQFSVVAGTYSLKGGRSSLCSTKRSNHSPSRQLE